MTALTRLLQLRRSLVVTLATRAVLIGLAVALGILAAGRSVGVPWSGSIGALAGAIAATIFLARLRSAKSLSNVALWVEERTPTLRYALVTVADGVESPILNHQALSVPWWTDARSAQLKSLVAPTLAALVTAALAIWAPVIAARVSSSARPPSATSGSGPVTDVLASIHVAVTPPNYAGVAPTAFDDPTSIESLVGSAITLSGKGDAKLLTASADSTARSVAPRGDGWSLSLTMPTRPAIIRLHSAAGRDRLIVLAPIADAAPAVTLLMPARDTIVRRAAGSIRLHAQLRDDIGLRDATFELVITSGGGENFTFRTGSVGRVRINNALEATLDARLSLDSLRLEPGDILQLRAVARDGNTVNGPGLGASETRALRVARADEYDSVSVEALPPPEEEQQVLSQRMLINLTEALVKKQRSLTRSVLVAESQRIAADQKKLRKRVGDVVFQRLGAEPLSEEGADTPEVGKLTPERVLALADSATGNAGGNVMDVEGDETPILAINKPLLEAFNAMWDAGRALEVGEPAKALPPMRIALAAIQKARMAERIYLRGKPGTQIVDLSKVRLSGKDKGLSSIREARLVVDPVLRRRNATFERVTAILARDPDAAADSLLLMRVEALGDAPALATALDEAARALRKRDAAAIPLAWTRVRRALGGAPVQRAGVSAWLGMP
ncbi:MAG: hypothetical protein V4550_03875 [Gemmatimonadota bacterium]